MGKVVIKKRVNLDFLGEEYKDAYVVFNSLPIKEYEDIIGDIEEKLSERESLALIRKILKDKFIEGKFPEDGKPFDLSKENMDEFDVETVTRVFQVFTGRLTDPKG